MNYMQKTIDLARRGEGLVSPNPLVGCIIVRNNEIIGEGWHKGPGFPHAEIEALTQADQQANGADLYVNLEPCCHYGNTPPCIKSIIHAEIKTVHIAMVDPNPLVNGQGISALQKAGIQVHVGECADNATTLNEIFAHFIQTQQPFVIAKWAMSLDGKIAAISGNSKWITSNASRKHAHQLRKKVDAILVGANTIQQDNSLLTARCNDTNADQIQSKQPIRVILDAKGSTPINAQVYQLLKDTPKTWVLTTPLSSKHWRDELLNAGVVVQIFDSDTNEKVDIKKLLQWLGDKKITSLLVEGGADVLSQFFKKKLVNKIYTYIGSKIIGGTKTSLLDVGVDSMENALPIKINQSFMIEENQLIISYPNWS